SREGLQSSRHRLPQCRELGREEAVQCPACGSDRRFDPRTRPARLGPVGRRGYSALCPREAAREGTLARGAPPGGCSGGMARRAYSRLRDRLFDALWRELAPLAEEIENTEQIPHERVRLTLREMNAFWLLVRELLRGHNWGEFAANPAAAG